MNLDTILKFILSRISVSEKPEEHTRAI